MDKEVEAFTASIHVDRRLYQHDIEGSMVHAQMLVQQGILTGGEGRAILRGLQDILREINAGKFVFDSADEDIHMAIEKALREKIGEAGGKLHTARSRNDQVSLDMRLYLRDELNSILGLVAELKESLKRIAAKEVETILPGYTHLQRAQPVTLAHYLLAYHEMLDRDEQRFGQCRGRMNNMPLGAGALAGTSLPIDRCFVAKALEFAGICQNSLDAVSDRDFVAEFIFDASLLMMHLSRFSEDLILWSTEEFGFVEISDAFTTGSSMMPQKKNPDVAELIRGKTGRIYGNLVAILTVLKGLPMTYNRDLQEDKGPLFDTIDTLKASLRVFNGMLGNLSFRREAMLAAAEGGFSTATDIAEYLVGKRVPFREAHKVVGSIVAYCLERNKSFAAMALHEYRKFHLAFEDDIYRTLNVRHSVKSRKSQGGTAPAAVRSFLKTLDKKGK
jgi:argininosuccinate lyase